MSDERLDDVPPIVAADESDAAQPRSARAPTSLIAIVAVVAALAALACSGVVLWQYRQFYVSLADADEATQSELEQVRAAAQRSDANVEDLARNVAASAVSLRDASARLDALPGRFADLEQRIDAIQGGSFDVRGRWLAAEAEYYLTVANTELSLGRRFDNALTALRFADDRLREIGDPGLASVRALVAEEILALESVRLLDIEGLAHSLARLSERVETLPVRAGEAAAARSDAGAEEPGLARLWASVRNAFTSIVRVERVEESPAAVLTAEEVRLIRRQLSVDLQSARAALISFEGAIFAASLDSAAALLREEFDGGSAEVEGAQRLVDSLRELDVTPDAPDISRSLAALRARGQR